MVKRWERALVVGASTGIGEAIARQLALEGTTVAVVARRTELLVALSDDIHHSTGEERVTAFPFDVTNTEGAAALFQEITASLGGLDLVVYAAGIMPPVGPEEYDSDADARTIETNFTGAAAWLNEAARRFSVAREGTIVGISSIAGDRGRRGNPIYGATKAALDTYLEALRHRLATRGVRVVTIKPGYVRTAMIGDLRTPLPAIPPDQAARDILDAAARGARVAYVPGWWRWIGLILRCIPAPIFEKLPIQ